MADEQQPASINLESAAQIVAAFVRRNQVGSEVLPSLISTVHAHWRNLVHSQQRLPPSGSLRFPLGGQFNAIE